MDSVGNMNHAVSVVVKWVFDSNNENFLLLNIDSVDLICASSDEDDYYAKSQVVYYAVRYSNPIAI